MTWLVLSPVVHSIKIPHPFSVFLRLPCIPKRQLDLDIDRPISERAEYLLTFGMFLLLQSIFTHARQKLQAGEELQSAQSAIPEPEVESEKEASDGEDEEDDNGDTVR